MCLKKIVFFSLFFLTVTCLSAGFASAAQNTGFTVQVETVSFEPAARAVVNRLKARGYDAYFESQAVTEGRVLYKVRFGRFATREEAVLAAKAYKKQEQRDCFVVQTMLKAQSASRPARAHPVKPFLSESEQTHERAREFYTLQIAAKTDKTVARKFTDRLQRKGYPAYLREPASGDSKPFYRIRIGRYESRAQAEQAGRTYAEKEQGEYLVVLSSPERSQAAVVAEPSAPVVSEEKPVTVKGHFFTVQVGVCKTITAAEKHADRVRSKGFDPYIMSYQTSKGKLLYRVRIGKFKERFRAKELAQAYEQEGGRDFIVVRTGQGSAPSKQNEPLVEPKAEMIQPDLAGQTLSQESSSVQETSIVKGEPVSVGKTQPGGSSGTILSKQEGTRGGLSSPRTEAPLQSPAGPAQVTKIYAYTGEGNELNLTNAYAKIPKELLERIQYVSIFPVMLLAIPDKGNALIMEVQGAQRRVVLSGLRLPEENRADVSSGIQEVLSAEPLRLKYSPDNDRKNLMIGRLYYRSGVDLQVELLKRGLAIVDAESLPAARQASLHAAQKRAQDLKTGIWSTSAP